MTIIIYTSHTMPDPVYSFDLISFHQRLCLQAPWCQIILTDNGKWFHFVALLINAPDLTLSSTSEIPDVSRFKAVCHVQERQYFYISFPSVLPIDFSINQRQAFSH